VKPWPGCRSGRRPQRDGPGACRVGGDVLPELVDGGEGALVLGIVVGQALRCRAARRKVVLEQHRQALLVSCRQRGAQGGFESGYPERVDQLRVGDRPDLGAEVVRVDVHIVPLGELEPEIQFRAIALGHGLTAERAMPDAVHLVHRVLQGNDRARPIELRRGAAGRGSVAATARAKPNKRERTWARGKSGRMGVTVAARKKASALSADGVTQGQAPGLGSPAASGRLGNEVSRWRCRARHRRLASSHDLCGTRSL
jgi:hypothetical protein